jgi:hypothetical protein
MMTYYRAWENQRFVRGLLREKQPDLAAALEAAVREASCLLCHGVHDREQFERNSAGTLGVLRAVYAGCRLMA